MGLAVGIGTGISFIPAVTIVEEYFPEKPTLPLGFAVSGLGMGTLLFPVING